MPQAGQRGEGDDRSDLPREAVAEQIGCVALVGGCSVRAGAKTGQALADEVAGLGHFPDALQKRYRTSQADRGRVGRRRADRREKELRVSGQYT